MRLNAASAVRGAFHQHAQHCCCNAGSAYLPPCHRCFPQLSIERRRQRASPPPVPLRAIAAGVTRAQ